MEENDVVLHGGGGGGAGIEHDGDVLEVTRETDEAIVVEHLEVGGSGCELTRHTLQLDNLIGKNDIVSSREHAGVDRSAPNSGVDEDGARGVVEAVDTQKEHEAPLCAVLHVVLKVLDSDVEVETRRADDGRRSSNRGVGGWHLNQVDRVERRAGSGTIGPQNEALGDGHDVDVRRA